MIEWSIGHLKKIIKDIFSGSQDGLFFYTGQEPQKENLDERSYNYTANSYNFTPEGITFNGARTQTVGFSGTDITIDYDIPTAGDFISDGTNVKILKDLALVLKYRDVEIFRKSTVPATVKIEGDTIVMETYDTLQTSYTYDDVNTKRLVNIQTSESLYPVRIRYTYTLTKHLVANRVQEV